MENSTTLQRTFVHENVRPYTSPVSKFMTWCTDQEEHRLLWSGVMLSLHGCILTPITLLLIAMTGVNMLLIGSAVFAMTFVLITNLAALPTKYTLPTFALSILADIVVLIAAFSI